MTQGSDSSETNGASKLLREQGGISVMADKVTPPLLADEI